MLQQAISGKLVGKMDNEVIIYDNETLETRTIKIKDRHLYVKKCKRAESVDGIAIPEKTRKNTTVCLVLAVGSGCGKWHELSEDEERLNETIDNSLFKIVECTAGDIAVGDKVFFPDVDPYGAQKGINRMPYGDDEYLVHECLAIGKCEE